MKDNLIKAEKFLSKHGLSTEFYDFDKCTDDFLAEMEKGLSSSSSLPMIPTYIESSGELPLDKSVLVLDAGGTNFRAALVKFDSGKNAVISDFKKRSMPGIERELSKSEFFGEIADFILDLAPKAAKIGFCFSYAMEKTPERDGRLLKFSKEIKAPEVEGCLVGRGVLEALAERGVTNIEKIILLNDTVATMLAGKSAAGSENYDSFIGLIVGTGINACYQEKNSNILKIPGLPQAEKQIINMESGSYHEAPSTDIDAAFRATTVDPAIYHYEKMISGAYLGPLCSFTLKTAAAEGVFEAEIKNMDGADLSRFMDGDDSAAIEAGSADSSAAEASRLVCNLIIERAALLTAVKLTAVAVKSESGLSPEHPVCICPDGSTFWMLSGFRGRVEKYLKAEFSKRGLHYVIKKVDNAPVIGAAVAGLTN